MIRRPLGPHQAWILSILGIIVIFGLYAYQSYTIHLTAPDSTIMPTWSQFIEAFHRVTTLDTRTGKIPLLEDAQTTGLHLFYGMALSLISALFIGLHMGAYEWVDRVLNWPFSFFQQIPPTVMIPVIYFFFAGTSYYVAMIFLGIVVPLALSIRTSVREVPVELIDKSYILGASSLEVLWRRIFRMILPQIIIQTRAQLSNALIFLIAAEISRSSAGFGHMIRHAAKRADFHVVFLYIAILGIFGLVMSYLMKLALHMLCPWYVQETK